MGQPHLQEGGGSNLKSPTLGEQKVLEIIWTLLASVPPPKESKNDALAMRGRWSVLICLVVILEGPFPGCHELACVLLRVIC